MSLVLTRIDELVRDEHFYLTSTDECYFLRVYTSHRGYQYSETNQLISNFKKPLSVRYTGQWYYKERAIAQIARELGGGLNPAWLARATLVPIPPSKALHDPLYDDRMEQVLRRISGARDVRLLVRQVASVEATHVRDIRPSIEELVANYQIDESVAKPPPTDIGLFDDVLTTGAHFRATTQHLRERFPGVPIRGFFIARRSFPPDEFPEFQQ